MSLQRFASRNSIFKNLAARRPTTLRLTASFAILVPLLLTSACSIQADKDNGDGKSDHVKISTPLGGLNVRSSNVDASSLGLPEYPGAHILAKNEDKGNDGQVDLHMGFGPWQMRVKVVTYGTNDAPDKVLAFYRGALGKFGDVIECTNQKPVGSPSVTKEGLGCSDDDGGNVKTKWNGTNGINISDHDLELKAGSRHRQHLVNFKKLDNGETEFALIALELPSGSSEDQTN